MSHLLQDLKGIFHYYITCVVELRVGRSNYMSHFCLFICLLCKKYRKEELASFPPPPPQRTSFAFYIFLALSATIINLPNIPYRST